jgi:hypothetical protein
MDRGQITRIIGAAYVAAVLLVLTAPTAYAASGDTSQDGWAHRSTQEVSPDGFSVRSTQAVSPDGFSVRSTQPAPKELTVASIKNVSPDGFSVRSTGPMPLDGWAVASVELPQQAAIVDGWAAGSTTETTPAGGIDGWSYAAISGDNAPASIARTEPPPRSSTPPFELYGLAGTLAAAAVAGVLYELHRRRTHHLPI